MPIDWQKVSQTQVLAHPPVPLVPPYLDRLPQILCLGWAPGLDRLPKTDRVSGLGRLPQHSSLGRSPGLDRLPLVSPPDQVPGRTLARGRPHSRSSRSDGAGRLSQASRSRRLYQFLNWRSTWARTLWQQALQGIG